MNETKKSPAADTVVAAPAFKERVEAPVAQPLSLDENLKKLAKYGGFNLIKATIEGADVLNPASKALRNIFLTDDDSKEERLALKNRLKLWQDLLKGQEDAAQIVEKLKEKSDQITKSFNENLKTVIDSSRTLEESYRALNLFYKNTGQTKVKNVSIVNASLKQLTDLENPTVFEAIQKEIEKVYDRLDLRQNYSMLVVPGYLKKKMIVDKWARMARENKVMLLTDFANLGSESDVITLFNKEDFSGGDPHLANVMMTCNWLVGRGKYETLGEEEDLHLPPSAALAGRLYGNVMSQPSAGVTHGTLFEVDGVRFDPLKSDTGNLEKLGLVPFCKEFGKVFAFSAKTLFNGNNIGLQTYSVVRVFDYLSKVVVDFLNRNTFQLVDQELIESIHEQMTDFLESQKGKGKLIDKYSIVVEKDYTRPDKINVQLNVTPFFPARTFVLKMEGTKGKSAKSAVTTISEN